MSELLVASEGKIKPHSIRENLPMQKQLIKLKSAIKKHLPRRCIACSNARKLGQIEGGW